MWDEREDPRTREKRRKDSKGRNRFINPSINPSIHPSIHQSSQIKSNQIISNQIQSIKQIRSAHLKSVRNLPNPWLAGEFAENVVQCIEILAEEKSISHRTTIPTKTVAHCQNKIGMST